LEGALIGTGQADPLQSDDPGPLRL
jgi:hypothetical protein